MWNPYSDRNILYLDYTHINILPETLYYSFARCHLGGSWVKRTWDLSVLPLPTAHESTIISIFFFLKPVCPDGVANKLHQAFKEDITPISHNPFQRIERKQTKYPQLICDAGIIPLQSPTRDIQEREN